MEDYGENNMYWWSDSLSHPRECHWSGMCSMVHHYHIIASVDALCRDGEDEK